VVSRRQARHLHSLGALFRSRVGSYHGRARNSGLEQWFQHNPYAEWYLNTLRIKDSPTYKHHLETYGKDFDYYQFAPVFNKQTAKWDPASWASVFKKTGARYAVLTTKHHDGFRLWPSKVPNPHRSGPGVVGHPRSGGRSDGSSPIGGNEDGAVLFRRT